MSEPGHIVVEGQREYWYQGLFLAAPDAMAIVAIEEGRLLDVNDAFVRLYGYSREELLGRTTLEMGLWVDIRDRQRWREQLRERDSVRDFEAQTRIKSGELRWLSLSAQRYEVGGRRLYSVFIHDITQRRQDEMKLRELQQSHERLAAMMDAIPDPAWFKDIDGRFLAVNAAWCSFFGRQAQDVVGKRLADFVTAEVAAVADEDDLEVVTEGRPIRHDEELAGHDAVKVWFDTIKTPWRDDAGQIVGTIGIARNITEKQAVRQALRESERNHRLLAENMADVIWTLDVKSNRFTYVSPSVERLCGYAPQEVMARSPAQIVVPQSLAIIDAALPDRIARFLKGDPTAVTQVHEVEQTCKDGSFLWTEVVTTLLKTGDDEVSVLGVSRDIHQRKAMETELVESERRFRAVFENATDGILIVDPEEAKLRLANPRMCQILGRPLEELTTMAVPQLLPPESADDLMRVFSRHASGECIAATDMPVQHKDGTIVYVDINSFRMELGGHSLLVGLFRDATERRKATEQTRLYEARLRQLAMEASLAEERERRELSGHLHDQVCQFLSLAQIRLSLMRQTEDQTDRRRLAKETEELVERANSSSRSLMLQLSHPALYDLGFVPAAEWLAEDIHHLYGVNVTLWDDEKPKAMDLPIRVLLFQCLRELLVNAAKYAQVEEVSVTISHKDGTVEVVVEDRGKGFDLQLLEGANATHGFGLFSIRERVRSLGGQMELVSTVGRGTRVVLEVPSQLD